MPATFSASPVAKAKAQDLTCDLDLSPEELLDLLDLTHKVKISPDRYAQALSGRYLSLLFEKPSLRTRLTFELAIKQLGGDSVCSIGPIGDREPLKDIARNLDRWTNGIVARTFRTIRDLPDSQRQNYLNSQQMRGQFSPQEHDTLMNLLTVAPLLPQSATQPTGPQGPR